MTALAKDKIHLDKGRGLNGSESYKTADHEAFVLMKRGAGNVNFNTSSKTAIGICSACN